MGSIRGEFLSYWEEVGIYINVKVGMGSIPEEFFKLLSRSRNLYQHRRHFNVEVEIYYFCQFTILTLFLSFRLIKLWVFFTVKKNNN